MLRAGLNPARGISEFSTVGVSDNSQAGSKAKVLLSTSHTTKPYIFVIIIINNLIKPTKSGKGEAFLEGARQKFLKVLKCSLKKCSANMQ